MSADAADAQVQRSAIDEHPDGSVVKALLANKAPPAESTTTTWTRRWVVLSFWVVAALLGLPTWIWTTTVHRAHLPLDSMNQWADGRACQLEFPLHIALEAPALRLQDVQNLIRLVQQDLDDHNESPLHHLRIGQPDGLELDYALTLTLKEARETGFRSEVHPFAPSLDIRYSQNQVPPHAASLAPVAKYVADELRQMFSAEEEALTYLLANSGHGSATKAISAASTERLNKRWNRAFKYSPTYHITFSLFAGANTPSAWEIQSALDEYLLPLLDSFASISTFTVDTQVQLYASLPPSMRGPTFDPDTAQWMLQRSDLSGFINAAEWPLSPSIGVGPTINFVVYIPAEKQAPLIIQETGGTSWLIPQWGGVQILNPTSILNGNGSTLSKAALEPIIHTFADQLISLLGLPRSPISLPLRLASLTRERAASVMLSASSTLGALARLTLKLTSIAIPDKTADSVRQTIHHLEAACSDLRNSRYADALRNARTAEAYAEQAFFDPSMVGQVYFPDEHKVAVYVPLLGPMAVPLVMAALKEVKKLRNRNKQSG